MSGGVELPWPPKELSPNARLHFRAKAAAVKSYRESAYWLTQSAAWDWSLLSSVDGDGPLTVRIVFHPPDRRKRDLDNMLASIKAGLDGFADALQVNDQRFGFHITRAEPVKGGRVVVTIQ